MAQILIEKSHSDISKEILSKYKYTYNPRTRVYEHPSGHTSYVTLGLVMTGHTKDLNYKERHFQSHSKLDNYLSKLHGIHGEKSNG